MAAATNNLISGFCRGCRHLQRIHRVMRLGCSRELCISATNGNAGENVTDSVLWNEYNATKSYCEEFGITLAFYREAVKKDKTFRWTCTACMCKVPISPDADPEVMDDQLQEMFDALQQGDGDGDDGVATTSLQDLATDGSLGSPVAESSRASVSPGSPELSNITFQPVQEVSEDSLLEYTVTDDIVPGQRDEVIFTIVDGSSQRQRQKLLDRRGFSYTKYSDNKDGSTTWRCSIRNKQMFCGSIVRQDGDRFIPGNKGHCHPGVPGQLTLARVSKQVKTRAIDNLFDPASLITDRVLMDNVTDGPVPSLPKPSSLARTANRIRQKQRPQHPSDLDFAVQHDAIPEATTHCINVEPNTVFANNEVNLSDIKVYGFDYDYTLACYTNHLHDVIYNQAVENLVERKMFPPEIKNVKYSPDFAIRGLHFDTKKGYLMKLDAFQHIQLGTVYRGKQPVSDEEVIESYRGTHIPESLMTPGPVSHPIKHLMDLFAIPEMALLANVAEYLTENEIDYDPEYLFTDIHDAVKVVHTSGIMHKEVVSDVTKYLETGTGIPEYIKMLHEGGKQLFLMTNSQFSFVNEGMKYLLGPDWIELFDVIITQARKPLFFHDTTRPFRFIYRKTGMPSWARVTQLRKGKIYVQGNMEQFSEMTRWDPSTVLYFGDHVYSDLADPCLKNGWRTGGIIPELDDEIEICNSVPFKQSVTWLVLLQELIQKHQVHEDPGCQAVVKEWLRERSQIRITTKTLFNAQFGSVFRTFHNPSYFTSRLCRFADIYTSCLGNLNSYSLNHTFYPRRSALPHELSFSNVLKL